MENTTKEIKKKKYYYNIIKSIRRKMYGGYNETANVYTIKKGDIILLGSVSWCTAAYKGDKHEIYSFLRKNKLVTKKEYSNGGGYHNSFTSKVIIQELPLR
jgi:hypothetical protein